MTAIITVRGREAAYLATDGAFCSPSGEMTALIAKVVHWPHVNAAAAFRGSAFVIPMLSGLALYASTYAQLKANIVDVARKITAENSALLGASTRNNISSPP